MPNTTSLGCYVAFQDGAVFYYVVLPVCIIIFCESVLVIATILRTTNLHTNTDIIVASLSATDILMCASYIAHGVHDSFPSIEKFQSKLLHNFLLDDSFGPILISITHMGFAAIDRYICIAHPFYYMKNMTLWRNFKILLAIWLSGLVYTVIPLLVYVDDKYHKLCILFKTPIEYYCIYLVGYLANIIIVFISYLKISCLALRHKKAAVDRRAQFESPARIQDQNVSLRSARFFAVMFGTFMLFTSPITIVSGVSLVRRLPFMCIYLK